MGGRHPWVPLHSLFFLIASTASVCHSSPSLTSVGFHTSSTSNLLAASRVLAFDFPRQLRQVRRCHCELWPLRCARPRPSLTSQVISPAANRNCPTGRCSGCSGSSFGLPAADERPAALPVTYLAPKLASSPRSPTRHSITRYIASLL